MRSITGDLIIIGPFAHGLLYWEEIVEIGQKKRKTISNNPGTDGGLDKVYSYGRRKKWPNSVRILKVETTGLANRCEVECERSQGRLKFYEMRSY